MTCAKTCAKLLKYTIYAEAATIVMLLAATVYDNPTFASITPLTMIPYYGLLVFGKWVVLLWMVLGIIIAWSTDEDPYALEM